MKRSIKFKSLVLFLFFEACILNFALVDERIAVAQESVGNILIDENTVRIEGISVNANIDGHGERSNISQSVSVRSIVNSTDNSGSSIQIGTVNTNKETFCEQLGNKDSQSNATKIVGNGRKIRLDHRVSPSVCIKGSLNKIIIFANTKVGTLYLDGSDNDIQISNATSVKYIDIVGEANTLTLPKGHNIAIKGLVDSNRVTLTK